MMQLRANSALYQTFISVVRHGSFTAAAQENRVPRPTLSRQVARLEEILGLVLLHRTTRRVWPTAAGQDLYDRVGPLLEALASAEEAVTSDATLAVGVVRVSVLPLLAPHLAPVLAHLHRHHPGLTVDAVVHTRLVDLRSEGYDVAIWAGEPRDPDLVVRTLFTGRVGLAATPTYLEERGHPHSIDALSNHTLIRGHDRAGRARRSWPLRDGGRFRVRGPIVTNDAHLLRAVLLQHQGIGLISDLNARDALADGRLVRVMTDLVGRTAVVRTVLPQRNPPTRVRVFLDALVGQFVA